MTGETARWDENFLGEFEAFLGSPAFLLTGRRGDNAVAEGRVLSDGSKQVYLAMASKFNRWLQAKGRSFSELDKTDCRAFLDSTGRDMNSAIATRYLRLLERCYAHLAIVPNPAAGADFELFKSGRKKFDSATVVLSDDEFDRFLEALPQSALRQAGLAPQAGWKRRRDRAMQLVMLCAGARVAEVIGLLVTEVPRRRELDGSLRIKIGPEGKHDTSHLHWTYLRPAAVDELLGWIDERISLAIPGPLAFPANELGDPLSKATVYRQASRTFERAGIAAKRSGGRTLRNTYAVQDLRNGVPIRDVADRLGLADEWSADTYKKASKLR
jgi:site-specific recombinase XerD